MSLPRFGAMDWYLAGQEWLGKAFVLLVEQFKRKSLLSK